MRKKILISAAVSAFVLAVACLLWFSQSEDQAQSGPHWYENLNKNTEPAPAGNNNAAPVTSVAQDGCIITGCSGQICSDQNMVSTCIYLPEFACYRTATCGRLTDGACGWKMTPQLNSCLELARSGQQNTGELY